MLINRMYKIRYINIREKNKIIQIWNEYIGEHFHYNIEQSKIHRNIEGPDLLNSELESTLDILNRKKTREEQNEV